MTADTDNVLSFKVMKRLFVPLLIILLLIPGSSALADITWKASLDFMEPLNAEAKDLSKGNWGLSGEMEFHFEGIPDTVSWAAGIDWIDMLGERTTYRDRFGVPFVHEIDQNYFRFWFGPRLRSHLDVLIKPYAGISIALLFYEYSSYVYLVPDQRTRVENDWELALGYGAEAGLEFRTAPGWSIDIGAKYLGTFGEPRQLSFDSVTVHPSHILYYVGVRFLLDKGQ